MDELTAATAAPILKRAAGQLLTAPVDVIGYASTMSAYTIGFDAEMTMTSWLFQLTGRPVAGTCASAVQALRAAMSVATAAEYALMLTDPGPPQSAAPAPGKLSARERELGALVAQGRTDAQIAEQLYISIRTVRSHLDLIRDKTGCRRPADLTRVALTAGLV